MWHSRQRTALVRQRSRVQVPSSAPFKTTTRSCFFVFFKTKSTSNACRNGAELTLRLILLHYFTRKASLLFFFLLFSQSNCYIIQPLTFFKIINSFITVPRFMLFAFQPIVICRYPMKQIYNNYIRSWTFFKIIIVY